jgi:hypothetical protein
MGHYAKIENGIVVQVNVVDEEFFKDNPNRYQGKWVKTSYNTKGGIHYEPNNENPHTVVSKDQSKALRKNYAGIGYAYDENRDAFIPPKPEGNWVLNEETCLWEEVIND